MVFSLVHPLRILLFLCLTLTWGIAQEVRVAAASDLDFAMRELKAAFEAANPGVTVRVQLGSSGNFYTQIQQGLPVDLFFSANAEFPERLEAMGFAEPGTRRLYAVGRMVLWVNNRLVQQGLDPEVLGMELLRDPRVIQLAVANPVHAPYGRAGVTLLEHYGFITRTRDVDWEDKRQGIPAYFDLTPLREGKRSFEFVYGENISQAAQLAATAANVGLIAYSLALAEDFQRLGKFWLAPLESHLRLDQEYIVITGQARPEVMAFYEFVGSPQGREILERYGFILPDAPESNGE